MPYTAPSPATLDWLARTSPGHVLSGVHVLPGSTSASLYRLNFEGGLSAVLRQFDLKPGWLLTESDLARHEASSLERAAWADVPTPRLLAFDEAGAECGFPSVLMTHLPGRVELNPPDFAAWIGELAAALASIHQVSPEDFAWNYFAYVDLEALRVPEWSAVPDAWARAIELMQEPRPVFTPHFIHRDFHPANLLWQGGKVSGLVDWVNACIGPVGADLAHCRVNLAQMYGPATADAFRDAYARRTGHLQETYWDVLGLFDFTDGTESPTVYPGWPTFGLHGLTDELIRTRLDGYLANLLSGEPGEH